MAPGARFALSCSFALAAAAFCALGASAQQQQAPQPAAASTPPPTDVTVHFKNGETYSGGASIAYPKKANVTPASATSSVQFVNGKKPKRSYALTFNGPGKIAYADGSTLSGTFVNGVIQGDGEYQKPDAFDFKGTFKDGQPTQGTVSFANGPTYEGSFADGLPSGQGTLTSNGTVTEVTGQWSKGAINSGYEMFSDGARFDGSFDSQGRPDGKGIYRYPDGTTLSGTWQGGLFAGPMVERYRNGTVLTVNVSPPDSALHGPATVAFADGARATGTVVPTGVLEGQGNYTFKNGTRVSGVFHEDRIEGPATLTPSGGRPYVGRVVGNAFISPRYKEYFGQGRRFEGPVDAQGRPNGSGVYRFTNGETLRGRWVHGRMNGDMIDRFPDGVTYKVLVNPPSDVLRGPATITFSNGDKASAILRSGSLNGPGSYVYAVTGNRIDGTFYQGRLRGKATLTTPDGDKFVGTMVNGTVQ